MGVRGVGGGGEGEPLPALLRNGVGWEWEVSYFMKWCFWGETRGRPLLENQPVLNLKPNEAQSARAESTCKGVNECSNYTTQVQQQRPESPTWGLPLVEFMYLVFTRMPGDSYHRRFRSLLLYLCTLKYRRYRGDLIQVFKIINGTDDLKFEDFFTTTKLDSTRNSEHKLYVHFTKTKTRKFALSNRVAPTWSSLLSYTKKKSTITSLKVFLAKIQIY